jgi:hypothetical protein
MEVQINGATTGELSDGTWLPVSLREQCSISGSNQPHGALSFT